jgi:GNAT superfamily N-acetyltransferase
MMTFLSNNLYTRPANLADLEKIVALLNKHSMALAGMPATTLARYQGWLKEMGLDLETNSHLVLTAQGDTAGYCALTSSWPHVNIWVKLAIDVAYRDQGVGAALLQWAETRTRDMIAAAPPGTRVVLNCDDAFNTDYVTRDLLVAHGYIPVRHFIHLVLELDSPPPEAVWPDGVRVEVVRPDHWPKLGPAIEEAFEDHWGVLREDVVTELGLQKPKETNSSDKDNTPTEEELQYFNTPGLCFVALAEEDVVGSCLCNAKTIEFPEAGKLGSLSIRRPWRRQGIGLALTYQALGAFYRRGIRKAITDTDANSFTNAPRLYVKAGFSTFCQQDVYQKELRSGRDLIKQTMETAQDRPHSRVPSSAHSG